MMLSLIHISPASAGDFVRLERPEDVRYKVELADHLSLIHIFPGNFSLFCIVTPTS